MKIVSLEHAAFEGPGRIADWAAARGHALRSIALYAGEAPPDLATVDLLVVMGGPMNIYQHRDHPWLPAEKRYLASALAAGKPVLGICLGAQLIADTLGAKIYQNAEKEIGWFPIEVIDRAAPLDAFPPTLEVLHWHGDTFELPPGARRVAQSAACENQAFVFGERVVGLQFHLEIGKLEATELTSASLAELEPAPFIQTADEILAGPPDARACEQALFGLLDALA